MSCAFQPPLDSGPGPGGDDDTSEPVGVCDSDDPDLRLCVDFDAPLVDRSQYSGDLVATGVGTMDRAGQAAAVFTRDTTIHVLDANVLDIDNALTIDMWIRPGTPPTPPAPRYMLDNNRQYAMSFTPERTIRCQIGSTNHTSLPIPDDGEFHHVACVYDRTQLKVYVDGSVSRCLNTTTMIPTEGIDGLAIGANLAGTNQLPEFEQPYNGELDNVRVWSSVNVDLCAAANRSGCKLGCD